MRRHAFYLILFLAGIASQAKAQTFGWADVFVAENISQTNRLATDRSGNKFIIGGFQGTIDFDPGAGVLNKTAAGNTDIFFAKYDVAGKLLWAHSLGSTGFDRGDVVATDAAGNLYLSGVFSGTADLDPGPGTFNATAINSAASTTAMFISKYSPQGTMLWTKIIDGNGGEAADHMTVDAAGNLVLSVPPGSWPVDYDPGAGTFNYSGNAGTQLGILKLDGNGNFIWYKVVVGQSSNNIRGLSTDANGNILFCGYLYSTSGSSTTHDFDPGSGVFNLEVQSLFTAFVCKWTSSGNFAWAVRTEGFTTQVCTDIAADGAGDVYVTGYFSDWADFEPGTGITQLSSNGGNDIFFWKLSSAGQLAWVHKIGSTASDAGSYLEFDAAGGLFLSGFTAGPANFNPAGGPVVLAPTSQSGFVGRYNAQGGLEWIRLNLVPANQFAAYGEESLVFAGSSYATADFDPGAGVYTVPAPPANMANLFLFQLSKASYIRGTTFFDSNGDGLQSASETGLPVLVKAQGNNGYSYYAQSDSNGRYSIETDTGTYVVTAVLPPYYTSALPASYTSILGPVAGSVDTGRNFALQPVAGINDLEVSITPLTPARPGRLTGYRLVYTNRGTTAPSGSVRLRYSGQTTVNATSVPPAADTAHTLAWNYAALPPLRSRAIDVELLPATNLAGGAVLQHIAYADPVTGDSTQANNRDTLNHSVTASFDPNEKRVVPEGDIAPSFVADGRYLDYTIHFQNTGTDTAFLVVLRDTLSTLADVNSLQMIDASHPYRLRIKEDRSVEWRFENILLPDSNNNELRSHGFVRYRLKIKAGTAAGNVIRNKAAIYFDYNAPVITNETSTRISVLTALPSLPEAVPTRVYPVPARSELRIERKGLFTWSLGDMSGRIIKKGSWSRDTALVPVTGLPAGSYWLLLQSPTGTASRIVVVQ